jgi:hypothetical protein
LRNTCPLKRAGTGVRVEVEEGLAIGDGVRVLVWVGVGETAGVQVGDGAVVFVQVAVGDFPGVLVCVGEVKAVGVGLCTTVPPAVAEGVAEAKTSEGSTVVCPGLGLVVAVVVKGRLVRVRVGGRT